jgi:dolichol-phosphate mannosyltransferase
VAPGDYEIVFVDDGSRDLTWSVLQEFVQNNPRAIAAKLSRNHGHQLALSAALSICHGDRILIIDADLQDPPELLAEMMHIMDGGVDVVYGRRRTRDGETAFKKITASLFYRLLGRLVDVQIPADSGDFRLISRRALDILNSMPEQHRFIRGMVSWIGFKQVPLDYDRSPRFAGATHYPIGRMLRFAIDAITGFSILPLRLASYLGLSFGIFGLFLLLYVIGGFLLSHVVDGWTSMMTVMIIIGSIQLMILGVVGEYLGRLYIEAKRRPLFIFDEIIGVQQERSVPLQTVERSRIEPERVVST